MMIHDSIDSRDVWTHWVREPGAFIAITLSIVLYIGGSRRVASGAEAVRRHRQRSQCFALATAVLVVALLSPLDALSESLFAAHMAQHVLLAALVPPLIVLSDAPLRAFRALPLRVRRRVTRSLGASTSVQSLWRAMTALPAATTLHLLALLVWHAPTLYIGALEHPALHALEHVSFVGTGCVLWWRIMRPVTREPAALPQGIAALFAVMMITSVLGALIVVSDHLWYPRLAPGAAAYGVAPLDDQRTAGLIMWVVGGLIYIAQMGALFILWMRAMQSRRVAGTIADLA